MASLFTNSRLIATSCKLTTISSKLKAVGLKLIAISFFLTFIGKGHLSAQACGSCASANCIGVKQYANKAAALAGTGKVWQLYTPKLTSANGIFTIYGTVITDVNGQVSAFQEMQFGGSVATTISAQAAVIAATRTYVLYAMSDATCATPIVANIANDGCSGTFNPAWTNLMPNTNYKLAITTNLSGLAAGYTYDGFNLRFYNAVRPIAAFAFNCGAAAALGTFTANNIAGQTGTLTVPISGATAGSASFNVTGTGFTGSVTTNIAAGQTSVSIPITYDGTGTAGARTLTVTSSQGTGVCTPSVSVKVLLSTFAFNCGTASTAGTFTANATTGQSGTITIPLSSATVGQASFSVSGGGFSGSTTTTLTAGQTSVTFPITYNGSGAAGNHLVTITSAQGTGTCAINIAVAAAGGSFAFNCGTSSVVGSFVANATTGQGGFVAVPITSAVAGTTTITVTGTGFSGTLTTTLTNNQTQVTIPITYDGSGAAGARPLSITAPSGTGTCTPSATVTAASPLGAITFNCPATASILGTFKASGTAQTGFMTVSFTTQTAGQVSFSVSGNGFTGNYTGSVIAGQTSVTMPINYDGSGVSGTHAVTVTSSQATGVCAMNIPVQALFDFACADYNTANSFTANGTSQNGTLVIPLSNVSAGSATFAVSGNGFTGTLTTVLQDSQRFVAIPVVYDGTGAAGIHAVAVTSSQASGTCAANVKVKDPAVNGCDYLLGQSISFSIHSESAYTGYSTEYILVDASGVIKYHVATLPFTGVAIGDYDAYAVNFSGTSPNLNVGTTLAAIGGTCANLSNAYPIKMCAAYQFSCGAATYTGVFLANGTGGQAGVLHITLLNALAVSTTITVSSAGFSGNLTQTLSVGTVALDIPIVYDGSGSGGVVLVNITGISAFGNCSMGVDIFPPPPATPFSFNCGAAIINGAFIANNTLQSGSVTIPLANVVFGTTNFTVSGAGFSGGLTNVVLTAGQTSITIPVEYNGQGPAGVYPITINSPKATASCATNVTVIGISASYTFDCGTATSTGTFAASGTAGQTGTLELPITGATAGTTTITVSGTGFTGTFTGFISDNQASISVPITFDGAGLPRSQTLTATSPQATGTCTPSVSVVCPTIVAPSITVVQTTCSSATGSITVTAPTSGVTYSFDNGTTYQAAATLGGLIANTYSIITKNTGTGCVSVATSTTINPQPVTPATPTTTVAQPICGTTTGTITVTAPTTGVTYSFDNGTSYQAAATSNALASGTYSIKVKGDVSGCVSTASSAIISTPLAVPSIGSVAKGDPSVSSCPALNDGTITVTATGSNLQYSKDNGVTWQVSNSFTGLVAGSYTIKVKDNVSTCEVAYTSNPVVLTAPTCNTCTTVGGTAVYTGGTVCSTANIGTMTLTGQTGTVIKWQTSTNGGTSWTDIAGTGGKTTYNFVNAANNQQFRAVVNADVLTCSDEYSSVVTITTSATACTTTTCSYTSGSFSPTIATSSNPTYTTQVVLINPTTGAITYVTGANSTAFTGVAVGDYIMYAVTYDNTITPIPTLTVGANISTLTGCFTVSDPLITKVCCPTIAAPTVAITQPSCGVTTGSITVTAPTTDVTYSFDNGATFQASATKSGLAAATTYQVLTKDDATACLSQGVPSVLNAILTVPTAPITTVAQPACGSTTGTITVTTPSTGVTYSFDNGTTFQASATSIALTTGTYQVKVKDAVSNCVSAGVPSVLNAVLAVPTAPTATLIQPTCTVATGTISVITPSTGVMYSFNNGVSYQMSATSSALTSGVYQVLVKDNSSGCTSLATPLTILSISPPSIPTLSVAQPVCFAKIGDITITAPTEAGMTYSIDGIDYTNTTGIFTGVFSGTYNVTAKSANGCVSASASAFMNPQLVPSKVGITEATCVIPTGTLVVSIPLGIGFSYSLDEVDFSNTTGVFPGLFPGSYIVFAKNASGCISKSPLLVIKPSVPPSIIEVNQPNCSTPTGTITITSPLTTVLYSFDNGLTFQSSNVLTNAAAGSYQIILKNISDGCEGLPKTVTVNAAPTVGCSCNNATGTIVSTISNQNTSADYTQGYVLTNNSGVIIQSSSTPNFTGLTSNQYAIYAINYKTTEGVNGLTIGQNVAGVNGNCLDVSVPLFYTVCIPVFACNNVSGNITAVVSGQNTGAAFTQSYVLTDENGVILKLSTTAAFTGLVNGKYKFYGVNYETAVGITGLTIGQNISALTGGCLNVSEPLLYQVCQVPEICNNRIDDDGDGLIDCEDVTDCPSCGCDNTTGDITFTNTGQTTTGYTQVYVLTDSTGKILNTNTAATFTGLSSGRYRVYAINYRTADGITGITVGGSISGVTGLCFDKSLPLLFKVCLCVTMNVKVMLEGPYQTASSTMQTILNQRGLLPGQTPIGQFALQTPQGQPYKGAPWNYAGTEGDTITTYPATVVDWVLLSLRSDSTTNANVFRVTGWLHNDGHISFISPCFDFTNGSYFVVIEHRNHVGVMSPNKVLITNGVLTHDFTINDSYVLINPPSFGQKQKGSKWVMYAGDGKKDTPTTNYDINFQDNQYWKLQSGIFDQYRGGDYNMDADVNFADNYLWKFNSGKYSAVPH
jgi:hypothetical protein